MTFQLTISLQNDAFSEADGREVARILRRVAADIDGNVPQDETEAYAEGTCRDINGNNVGGWHYMQNVKERAE